MRTKIRVTEEHIRRGKIGSAERCPYALAIKDALPDRQITVGYLGCYHGRYLIQHDDSVKERLIEYDHSGKMEPFETEIRGL